MGELQRRSGEARLERRVFGFVEGLTRPDPTDGYARAEVALDAVDADFFAREIAPDVSLKALSIIRVQTTPRRWRELLDEELEEGDWLEIKLAPRHHAPIAWILDAADDYEGAITRTNVIDVRRLDRRTPILNDLRSWCAPSPESSRSQPATRTVTSPLHVRVVDVGHASFAALHTTQSPDAPILGYFDVGGPIFFHDHTLPPGLVRREGRRIPTDGFVALSHWDFDHYALAVSKLKALQRLRWIAPNQAVGPNARRLQGELGPRLTLLQAPTVTLGRDVRLYKGLGPASDRNNSGYALRVDRAGRSNLLTGDLDYDFIPPAAKAALTGLAITHHGGKGGANPPFGSGRAVASYGLSNRYGHPVETYLASHAAAGWIVSATAERHGVPRGDRWLT